MTFNWFDGLGMEVNQGYLDELLICFLVLYYVGDAIFCGWDQY